ncbi:histidine kinase dimerization/phospho-acceptor domain-containing protein [Streptosporangium lutulentum]
MPPGAPPATSPGISTANRYGFSPRRWPAPPASGWSWSAARWSGDGRAGPGAPGSGGGRDRPGPPRRGRVWLLAGTALRPVERMRRTASDMHVRDPAARLDVPRTRDEIAALALTFNDLLARLQSSLWRQRRFVAEAGHELRSPLAVLQAELDLATRPGRSRAELTLAVAGAAEETRRLTRLADNLLLLAQNDEDAPLTLAPAAASGTRPPERAPAAGTRAPDGR